MTEMLVIGPEISAIALSPSPLSLQSLFVTFSIIYFINCTLCCVKCLFSFLIFTQQQHTILLLFQLEILMYLLGIIMYTHTYPHLVYPLMLLPVLFSLCSCPSLPLPPSLTICTCTHTHYTVTIMYPIRGREREREECMYLSHSLTHFVVYDSLLMQF